MLSGPRTSLNTWVRRPNFAVNFCPHCGSRLFSADDREAEIKLGILSEVPTPLVPSYELWIKRREPWLRPIEGAEQYEENRS
jgi:hypothetical protein